MSARLPDNDSCVGTELRDWMLKQLPRLPRFQTVEQRQPLVVSVTKVPRVAHDLESKGLEPPNHGVARPATPTVISGEFVVAMPVARAEIIER